MMNCNRLYLSALVSANVSIIMPDRPPSACSISKSATLHVVEPDNDTDHGTGSGVDSVALEPDGRITAEHASGIALRVPAVRAHELSVAASPTEATSGRATQPK
jgi:hypothetical protein